MDEPYRIVLETDDPDMYVAAVRALQHDGGDTNITVNLARKGAPVEVPVEVPVRVAEVHVRHSNGAFEVIRTAEQAVAAGA